MSQDPQGALLAHIKAIAHECSYYHIEVKGEAGICCIHPLMFTVAILADLNTTGHEDRWCYKDYASAKAAYDAWDGTGEPTGWHRHPDTGRRIDEDGKEYIMR